jgi:hypothetical protein
MFPKRRVNESYDNDVRGLLTLNSPESLLYTSVQSASVCLDLEELRLRFRTARTPRLSKRHIGNWTFFCDSSILKG